MPNCFLPVQNIVETPTDPANIRLDEEVLKTSFVFVFKRRLQDASIKINIFALVIRLQDDLVKTNIFVFAKRLQDVFKTFSRRFQDVLPRRLQDVLKTSSRHLQYVFKMSCKYVFKTSSRRLAKISLRHFQDVSSGWTVLVSMSSRSTPKTVIYWGICLGHTTSEKFMISVQNLQKF